MHRNSVYIWGNTELGRTQDLLILCRNSVYDVAYLPTMDLPSVFKIDKIQDLSVSTTYLTVCLCSHLRLAFSKLRLLAITAKISYQLPDRTAYDRRVKNVSMEVMSIILLYYLSCQLNCLAYIPPPWHPLFIISASHRYLPCPPLTHDRNDRKWSRLIVVCLGTGWREPRRPWDDNGCRG